jgi:type IX secretion system PorP/SprF family membrane protein
MKMRSLRFAVFVSCFFSAAICRAQDPSFSQFFSSPLNVNPALTANINSTWRMVANLRDQWIGPISPYFTGTISFDTKALQKQLSENTVLGLGGMLMHNQSMGGILKGNFASFTTSYNVLLASNDADHRLGIGIGMIYANKTIDKSRLYFAEQFTGYGFDRNLPNGETALAFIKPYFSTTAGLLYSYTSTYTNIDIGGAAFHINKPKQTYMQDEFQRLPIRYVGHANMETYLNDGLILNLNTIYQRQAATNYYSVGGALGYFLTQGNGEDAIVNFGMWYWSANAIVPYVGFAHRNYQLGLSYDVTISKLAEASIKPRTFELSFILRGERKEKYILCPWK